MHATEHCALFYHGRADYTAQLGMFIDQSLSDGFPVVAALPEPHLSLLRQELSLGTQKNVEWIDMALAGRNPARILPGILMSAVRRHSGRRLRFIGESAWPGRCAAEYQAAARYEALVNEVLPEMAGAVIVCPYDARSLSEQVLADAELTHPMLADQGNKRVSGKFDPQAWKRFNVALEPPPADAASIAYAVPSDLSSVRDFVVVQGFKAGLPPMRTAQAVQAANELAANTVQHAAGGGRLFAWQEQGTLVLQADDHGQLSPLAGQIPPANGVGPGNGLILVNVLCDLVQTYAGPEGTSVRITVRPA